MLYLGRAPRTKETLLDFLKWRRVTRHPLVFHGLTGSQRTPGLGHHTRRCLTRVTYLAIRGSRDSYSAFTCPTTNWESLRIISLSTYIVVANSIPARMASYSDSLFEALKPNRIACSILSPPWDLNYRPMSALVCRDAQSTLRIH